MVAVVGLVEVEHADKIRVSAAAIQQSEVVKLVLTLMTGNIALFIKNLSWRPSSIHGEGGNESARRRPPLPLFSCCVRIYLHDHCVGKGTTRTGATVSHFHFGHD